jgi:ATP-dependent RNA helicase MSS116
MEIGDGKRRRAKNGNKSQTPIWIPIQKEPPVAEASRNFQTGQSEPTVAIPEIRRPQSAPIPANAAQSVRIGEQKLAPSISGSSKAYMTNETFVSLNISPVSKRGIVETMGYSTLTTVQAQALPAVMTGNDVLGQAKTGTGKTLAFLIPSVETLLKYPVPDGSFGILVLSPTRELASQIATEATKLCSFHTSFKINCFVGGTNMKTDQKIAASGSHILVATPGRLLDHMQNTQNFAGRFASLRMLVLDEADQLLEMGFQPDIIRILKFLCPREKRQTLLFSATVPKALTDVAHLAMRPNYLFVNTIPANEAQTHKTVPQFMHVSTMEEQLPVLMSIIANHVAAVHNYKIIIFFTTARLCGLMAEIATECGIPNVLEIHSRKSQAQRTKTSDAFRQGSQMVLFSSDVSARGVDYPDVTLVLQVGFTDREAYIHRLGRTARASGSDGYGLLLVFDWEAQLMTNILKGLPLQPLPASEQKNIKNTMDAHLFGVVASMDKQSTGRAYSAWLGFYKSHAGKLHWDSATLVQYANRYAGCLLALDASGNPPPIPKKTVGMMGLKGVPGLNVVANLPGEGEGRGGGQGGHGGRGRGRGGGHGGTAR